MKFDKVIRKLLEEYEVEVVRVKGGVSGQEFRFARDFEAPELDDELEIDGTMPGSPAVVALEIVQRSIDLVKEYNIPVPSAIEHLIFDIFTDSLTEPKYVIVSYGWTVDEEEDMFVVFHYVIYSPNISPANVALDHLIDHNIKKITLDQLKKMADKETTDRAMKGHELEDLYNL